jgi:hypothetical protein
MREDPMHQRRWYGSFWLKGSKQANSNTGQNTAASSGGKMESIPDGDLGLGFEKSGRLTE